MSESQPEEPHPGPGDFRCFQCDYETEFTGRPSRDCPECGAFQWILLDRKPTRSPWTRLKTALSTIRGGQR